MLHAALDPDDGNGLIGRFYTRWFDFDASPRDLFPPDMGAQRAAFAQALKWVYGELVAQRADEPVAFLAQLGRDHRKYGVLPQHYETLGQALYDDPARSADRGVDRAVDAAAHQSLNLITGVMSGAADAEQGPAWWDGTVVEHLRVSRDLAVVRLQLDQPMHYHAGQYVNVAVPQCPRRWRYLSTGHPTGRPRRRDRVSRPRRCPAAWSAPRSSTRPGPATGGGCPARTARLQVDRDGGDVLMVAGSTGLAPLRAIDHGPHPLRGEPARAPVLRRPLPVRALRPADPVADRLAQSVAVGDTGLRSTTATPPWAADYPDVTPPRGLHLRQTGKLLDVVTRYGGWGDRQILICGGPEMVARHQGRADRQRGPAGAYSARPVVQLVSSGAHRHAARPVVVGRGAVRARGRHDRHLADRLGVELLGQRRGLDAYVANGKTMGIPIAVPVGKSIGQQHI